MRRSKITIVLVTGLLLAAQVSAFAQGDRPSSGGASPAPATEAADAPAKAATPSSETSMMKGTSANPAAEEPSVSLAQLPQDLSPWGMFLHADTIVKAVMIGLAVASLVTWTVWVAKSIELFGARAAVRRGLRILANATTLAQAHEKLRSTTGPVAQLMQAAANEIRLSANLRADGLKERIAWQSERIEMAAGAKDFARNRHPGHDRRHSALRRPVRDGLGHHGQLHRHLKGAHHKSRGRGARHRGGAACNRARPRRRHPGSHDL